MYTFAVKLASQHTFYQSRSTPAQPLTKKGSAGTLSQYLAASSSANKDATPSDSDDDFFK